jgi:N-acetylneuraminic acid mutarotase
LAARQSAAGAWTGRELVIAGGFTERVLNERVVSATFKNAAAYRPKTRTWRQLPPMPAPRRGAVAVWNGRDVLVVGGQAPGARGLRPLAGVFAYRPSTNAWRQLSPLPRGRAGFAAVWTGKRLLVWGGTIRRSGQLVSPSTGLSYDPATNRWSPIPTAPIAGRGDPTAVWTGGSMIVAGGVGVDDDEAAAYAP